MTEEPTRAEIRDIDSRSNEAVLTIDFYYKRDPIEGKTETDGEEFSQHGIVLAKVIKQES